MSINGNGDRILLAKVRNQVKQSVVGVMLSSKDQYFSPKNMVETFLNFSLFLSLFCFLVFLSFVLPPILQLSLIFAAKRCASFETNLPVCFCQLSYCTLIHKCVLDTKLSSSITFSLLWVPSLHTTPPPPFIPSSNISLFHLLCSSSVASVG